MHFFSLVTLMTLVHLLVIIGVSLRVIKVRLPVAAAAGQRALYRKPGAACQPASLK
jgi:hypothetical protein